MFKQFTPSARQIVLVSVERARAFGHAEMGAEHLLLGALRSGGVSQTALTQLGLCEDSVRAHVEAMLPRGKCSSDQDISLSAEGVWTLAAAVRFADENDAEQVGSGHILLALAESDGSRGLLRDCCIALDSLCSVVADQPAEPVEADVVQTVAPCCDDRVIMMDVDEPPSPGPDARVLLALVQRRGRVASWLAGHGIDDAAVRAAFEDLDLDATPPAARVHQERRRQRARKRRRVPQTVRNL